MEQKTGRKLLLFLLALAMVIGLLPGISLTVQAESAEGTCGDGVTWSYDAETKALSISYSGSGTGAMTDYESDAKRPWYSFRSDIKKVIIGSGVTSIGEQSFLSCSSLIEVTIPLGVKYIGNGAFAGCNSLTGVTIPSSVTSIGSTAFSNCSGLTNITFERPAASSTLTVGKYAFCTDENGTSNIPIRYAGSGTLILFDEDTQITTDKVSGDLNGKDLTWEEAGEKYPLWVGDTRVTASANSGEGWSYDAASNTLTLSGLTITTGYRPVQYVGLEYGIYYAGSGSLEIALATGSVNTVGSQTQLNEGILALQGGITISGEGELSVYGNSDGIEVKQNLTIKSGTVRAAGTLEGGIGLYSDGDVTIEGGTVIAVSDVHDNGICAKGNVIIKGGSVTASGKLAGIYTSESGNLVKNAIAGTGWTDVAGTEGETAIAVSAAGQQLNQYKKVQFLTSHTHSFAYTASGATITATCGAADCPLADHKATLTINEPTGLTYDGTAKAADVTGGIPGETTPEITYAKEGDASLTGIPTDAGSYTASITLEGATASVSYSIEPKSVTITGLSASDKEYDGTTTATPTGTAVISGKVDNDDVGINNSTAKAEFADANVGSGKTVTFSGYALSGTAAGNYTLSAQPESATASITPKSITGATVTLKATQLEYSGSEQSVSVNSVKLGDATLRAETDFEVTNGSTGTNVGTYTVTVTGRGNYKDTATASWAINDKPMTVTAEDVTATYDGQTHGISVTVSDPRSGYTIKYGNAAGTCDLDASPTITNVGEGPRTVYYQVTADNYETYTGSATVTINKAPLTVTAQPKTITYGDAPANVGVEYSGFVNSEPESVLEGTLGYDYSYTQYGDVGSYTITPKGLTAANYEISFAVGTLTVEQKEVGLTWSDTSLTFNGSAQVPTATATGTVNSDAISVTVSGGQTNAGTGYTATASGLTGDKAGNYKLPGEKNTTFAIGKAAAKALADVTVSQVYTLTGVSASVSGKMPDDAGSLSYAKGTASKTGSVTVSGWNVDSTGTVTATISGGAAGDNVILPVTITSDNYADTTINAVITLTEKETATVTKAPTAKTLAYTGSAQELVTAGEATGGEMQYALGNETEATQPYTTSIPTATDAGTYYVWYKVAGDGNHTDSEASAPVTVAISPVNKAALNEAISAAEAYYDEIRGNADYAAIAETLKEAIDAAKALAGNDNATEDQVSAAISSVAEAENTAKADKQAADEAAAKAVADAIRALSDSPGDKDAVAKARAAYDALTDDQKKLVPEDVLSQLTTAEASVKPTPAPTTKPTVAPTATPTAKPTAEPTAVPTAEPTTEPSAAPTAEPTATPTAEPTAAPKVDLSKCKLTVKDQTYTGKALKPAVVVKYGKVKLKQGTDYTVSYKNNVKPGKATVTVKGKGNYTGSAKVSFAIRVPLSKCKVTVKSQTYTGKALKPAFTVKFGKTKLKVGTDYTVTYKNNKKVGLATATVKGKGKYSGSKKVTFRINPKGTAFTKLTGGNRQITLKWRNPKNVTGYEIQYSLKKNFSGKKTVKIKKAKTLSATVKKLKANKTYYVRIRTYATVNKKNYYSAWSKAIAVKTRTGKANNDSSDPDLDIAMNACETLALEPLVSLDDSDGELIWTTSDEAIATVSQDGVVNALKPGDVVLTATGESGKKITINIRVDEAEELTLTILEDDDLLPDIDDGFDEVIVM